MKDQFIEFHGLHLDLTLHQPLMIAGISLLALTHGTFLVPMYIV